MYSFNILLPVFLHSIFYFPTVALSIQKSPTMNRTVYNHNLFCSLSYAIKDCFSYNVSCSEQPIQIEPTINETVDFCYLPLIFNFIGDYFHISELEGGFTVPRGLNSYQNLVNIVSEEYESLETPLKE